MNSQQISNQLYTDEILNPIIRKDEKDQESQLLQLSMLANLLEEEIGKAKGAKLGSPSGSGEMEDLSDPSGGANATGNSFEDSMTNLALALQMLQVTVAESGNKKSQYDEQIAQAQVNAAQKTLESIQNTLAKLEKKEKTQQTWGVIAKVCEYVVAGALIIGSFFGGPELAIMGVMLILSASGALSGATKGIADLLQEIDPKMSSDVAQGIAGAIVTALVIAGTLGAGAATGMLTVGEEVGEEVAQQAVSKVAKLVLMNALQAISGTGFISDFIASAYKDSSKGENAQAISSLVIGITTAVLSFGVGFSLTNAADVVEDGASMWGKITSQFRSLTSASKFLQVSKAVSQIGMGASTVSSGMSEIYNALGAFMQKDLTDENATMGLLKVAMNQNNNDTRADQQFEQQEIKTLSAINPGNWMAGEAGIARTLQNSPV